jgi:hypothetical protein
MIKLNRDEKASIRHALMHLESNNIHKSETFSGSWYCGNKEQFIRRHIKALALIRSLCEGEGTQKGV